MRQYNYKYRIGLAIVNPEVEFDFKNDKINESLSVEQFIRDKIREFTAMSQNSTRNSKRILEDSVVITKTDIIFTICSENELPVVGKSIRRLSQLLITEQYFEKLLFNKKLFKTYIPSEILDEETGDVVDVVDASTSISNSDFVKALIDFLLMPQYPYTKEKNDIKNAVQEMKAIAVKSGMIKL